MTPSYKIGESLVGLADLVGVGIDLEAGDLPGSHVGRTLLPRSMPM